ncbi:MAG: hypothetical protein V8R55_02435 [Dysosmobacter sp.]
MMLPLTAISLIALTAAAIPVLPRTLPVPDLEEAPIRSPKKLGIYLLLFALCLLTVFRILPYGIMTVAVLAVIAVVEFSILKELDFGLLVTFVCFFIVSGNLGRIDAVHTVLQSLLERSTCLTAVLTSQIISNVPAAVLLSGFTDNWQPLLEGVNIGGLGTPHRLPGQPHLPEILLPFSRRKAGTVPGTVPAGQCPGPGRTAGRLRPVIKEPSPRQRRGDGFLLQQLFALPIIRQILA